MKLGPVHLLKDSTWQQAEDLAARLSRALADERAAREKAERELGEARKRVDELEALVRKVRVLYKQAWNEQAGSEDAAKFGVAGYVDEEQFAKTGADTCATIHDCVKIKPTDDVLEIGAGVGRVGRAMAPMCRSWTGADVSENMLSHLRKRLADLPNVRTVALSGFDLAPVPDASLDVVYSTVVMMHLDEWERYNYIKEAFRVLRPGGRLLADNFNLLSDEGWGLFEHHRSIPPLERPSHMSKSSTPQEMETYFRRAGFVDVQQRVGGLWVITYGTKPDGAGGVSTGGSAATVS
jgi:SAM-dependent methyltransferase